MRPSPRPRSAGRSSWNSSSGSCAEPPRGRLARHPSDQTPAIPRKASATGPVTLPTAGSRRREGRPPVAEAQKSSAVESERMPSMGSRTPPGGDVPASMPAPASAAGSFPSRAIAKSPGSDLARFSDEPVWATIGHNIVRELRQTYCGRMSIIHESMSSHHVKGC
jgi:hypothetical protein